MGGSAPRSPTFPARFGRYTLVKRVASGGMAAVFLAVEETAGGGRRFVTIKRIRSEYESDPDFVEFFVTEGRVSLSCAHPNLPLVLDMGAIDDLHYLAMEYIHGHTLLEVLRGAIRAGEMLSVNAVISIGLGLAAALEHVHGLRDVDGSPLEVIHRDVTPQNVMISTAGSVKLIDFGIVRSAVQTHQTQTGIVKGKFAYMAPELFGEPPAFDHRADLFSLGIVLHEALCARPLFRADSDLGTVDRVKRAPIDDPADVRGDCPPEVGAVVLRALARDPDARFHSATEMLSALEHAADAANLSFSVVRMRDEIASLCGAPATPALPPDVLAALDTPPPEARAASPEPEATGLDRDPLLRYFLEQGEARPGPTPRRDLDAGPKNDTD